MNASLIRNVFQENHGVLTTRELNDLGISHYNIRRLLEENVIDKVKRGIYVLIVNVMSRTPYKLTITAFAFVILNIIVSMTILHYLQARAAGAL
jgi:predicted transcriptional regulator of viral defense system